ncbi:CRYAB.2 family protein [Megaselia abdita]
MSLFPMFVNFFEEDDYAFALSPKDFFEVTPVRRHYRSQKPRHHHQQTQVKRKQEESEEDIFKVHFDVSDFTPEELLVKTVDNVVVIEGKHEEKEDGNCLVSRQFLRKYPIPEGFDPETVRSSYSETGKVLTIKGAKTKSVEDSKERLIQIQQH